VVPVSNGESISTAPAGIAQEFAAKFWRVFFLSTLCPQKAGGCPQLAKVIHQFMHNLSTDYRR
jgi:hypothetical protein